MYIIKMIPSYFCLAFTLGNIMCVTNGETTHKNSGTYDYYYYYLVEVVDYYYYYK